MDKKAKSVDREPAVQFEGDENPERGNWSGKLDFLLSCLGYAVGLGNVWRFPYLCFKNGGGAFLIPYTFMLFLIGIPVFFLELTLGQYSAMSPLVLFKNIAPFFRGIGWTMFLCSCMVGIYYNNIIAWTIYYFIASCTSGPLPWSYCGQDHNTPNCFNIDDFKQCIKDNSTNVYNNGMCMNETFAAEMNFFNHTPPVNRTSPSQEYLDFHMFGESDGIHDIGGLQWKLVLCLLASWIVVFFCLIRGIKSSGRVVYFTATFPYLVILILLIRGATLPGAVQGINFYVKPNFTRVMEFEVWESAAIQIFFSLSTAGGGLITLASYNRFHTNVIRDTLIVCFGNCLTSVFAGFAIFSILGFIATEQGVEVQNVVKQGSGLAFIAYPDAVTRMPVSTFWAIVFFLMLFTLGLDSQFAIVENVSTSLMDMYPNLRPKKVFVMLGISICGFLLGLPITTKGGRYVLELMDYYAAGWPYLFVGLMELLIVSYVYGIKNFFSDIYEMIKWRPGFWFKSHFATLYFTLAPLVIALILLLAWIGFKPLKFGEDDDAYIFPMWSNAIGWLMCIIPISAIPIGAVFHFFYGFEPYISKTNRLKRGFKATSEWRENAMRIATLDGPRATAKYNINGSGDIVRTSSELYSYDNPAMNETSRL